MFRSLYLVLCHKSSFCSLFYHMHIGEKGSAFLCPRWIRKSYDFFTDNCFGYKTRKAAQPKSKNFDKILSINLDQGRIFSDSFKTGVSGFAETFEKVQR